MRARVWLYACWALVMAVLLVAVAPAPAIALTTVPGDQANRAYTHESVRSMTWNLCGEAGGSLPSSGGFCPFRNDPEAKAAGVAEVVRARGLNTVMLQEVCSGPFLEGLNSGTRAPSQLDQIAAALGPEWSFEWTEVWRPANAAFPDGSSYCRGGLTGTLGVAIGVKGDINWTKAKVMPVPIDTLQNRTKVLCVEASGWENHICTAHVANFDEDARRGRMTQAEANSLFAAQIETVRSTVAEFPSVVLGGDFNTQVRDKLQPLYSALAECDQQSYGPADASNEPTHFTPAVDSADAQGAITDPSYYPSKIDYLFSTAGFTGCDSWTQKADQADYTPAAQPSCNTVADPVVCTPTGISDHTPLYGHTRGGPELSWSLDGSASGGSGGHQGTLSGGASWTSDHGGAIALDGSTGTVESSGPVLDTSRSFTVSAWAKVAPDAPTSVVLSQDGSKISGVMLWYNQGDSTWRFALPKTDSTGWSVDQAVSQSPAKTGVWTRLTGVYDAVSGAVVLYVDGVEAGRATHSTPWQATGPFVVGRDLVNGSENAFWKGAIQQVETYDYPMTASAVASHARVLTPPTGTTTQPASTSPGCHQAGGYSTVSGLKPQLTARVTHPDPSREVWAEFSIWDNTDPSRPQPIHMGGPGSASAKVKGGGSVSVSVPELVDGHSYGWYVRAADGSTTSPTTAVCHFRATVG
ncbi:LamG-like jellyroll fold domain-containing protein [Streptomyces sp. NPDC050418]|uniref:LamG-like jellyroll fold domain-containing protein n=1 Tax=Streptomyces sp. NPDC050418 TaxID=3365612 RepID=UPI003797DEAD